MRSCLLQLLFAFSFTARTLTLVCVISVICVQSVRFQRNWSTCECTFVVVTQIPFT